jgi:putative SOS response-associated peptidase YedK
MPGRLVRDADLTATSPIELFKSEDDGNGIETGYNLAPGRLLTVVVESDDGEREFRRMHWGLKRPFSVVGGPTPIHARAESILQKPLFRNLLATRRCLVPVSGYYEWKQVGKRRIPHFIRPIDTDLASLAAIFDAWWEPDGTQRAFFCTITVPSSESIAEINHRMPVILRREDEALWLDRTMNDESRLLRLLRPYPSHLLEAYPVDDAVNDARREGAELMAPRKDPIFPQLSLPI